MRDTWACKLGIHDNHTAGWKLDPDTREVLHTYGYCLRCNEPWQLDS